MRTNAFMREGSAWSAPGTIETRVTLVSIVSSIAESVGLIPYYRLKSPD